MFPFTLVAPATALGDLVFNHSLRGITEFHLRNRTFPWASLFFLQESYPRKLQCQNKPSWCSPFSQLLLYFMSFLLALPTLPIRSCIYSHFSDLLSHSKNAFEQQFMFLAARPCNIKTQCSDWELLQSVKHGPSSTQRESCSQVLEQQDVNVTQKKSFALGCKRIQDLSTITCNIIIRTAFLF